MEGIYHYLLYYEANTEKIPYFKRLTWHKCLCRKSKERGILSVPKKTVKKSVKVNVECLMT